MATLVVLTGASGSGKTAIADAIDSSRRSTIDVFRFDRMGVPSAPKMVAGWGSGEAWQRAMTLEWMARISGLSSTNRPVLFEGQMRLAFVREGLFSAGITWAQVVLVDCDDEARAYRLAEGRNQPELANSAMMDWARFLRREAQAGGYQILDTSKVPLEESVERICALFRG